jgi:hypothetical protein
MKSFKMKVGTTLSSESHNRVCIILVVMIRDVSTPTVRVRHVGV